MYEDPAMNTQVSIQNTAQLHKIKPGQYRHTPQCWDKTRKTTWNMYTLIKYRQSINKKFILQYLQTFWAGHHGP